MPDRPASELLREWRGKSRGPYRIAGIPPGVISDNDYDVTDEALALMDAIPALIALVEAAENAARVEQPYLTASGYRYPLRAALADLRRELGGEAGLKTRDLGGGARWCEFCAITAQLAHARERAAEIPRLEARLAALTTQEAEDA